MPGLVLVVLDVVENNDNNFERSMSWVQAAYSIKDNVFNVVLSVVMFVTDIVNTLFLKIFD